MQESHAIADFPRWSERRSEIEAHFRPLNANLINNTPKIRPTQAQYLAPGGDAQDRASICSRRTQNVSSIHVVVAYCNFEVVPLKHAKEEL